MSTPSNNSTIQIVSIPHLSPSAPEIPQLVSQYKGLRLSALQLEPSAFSSTYERESQFPYETWVSRVQNPRGKTFVALSARQSQYGSTSAIQVTKNIEEELRELLENEWVGLFTLLGPEVLADEEKREPWMVFLDSGYGERDAGLTGKDGEEVIDVVYMGMGMFVLPTWRARGIGRGFIEAAVNGVREQKGNGWNAIVTAMVEKDNGPARRLYEGCGFDVKNDAVQFNRRGEDSEIVAMAMDIN